MFANCQLGGVDFAFPDVCNTPVGPLIVPLPYPNTAQGTVGVPGVSNILISGGLAHNLATTMTASNGDESGAIGGVASGTVMSTARHVLGANTVLLGGMPATRLTSITVQNLTNTSGARISPSQTIVLILAA